MGVEPSSTRLQLEPSCPISASPALRRVKQCASYARRTAMRSDRQILNPSTLSKAYGDDVEIDGCKSDERHIVIRYQNGRPIVDHCRFEPADRESQRPVSRAYPGRGKKPVVGGRDSRGLACSSMPDHVGDTQSYPAASVSCERRESRARRAEEEGAEALFPLRATTK
jgi:hypothetical protein